MNILQGHEKIYISLFICALFVLSGCNKIIDWGKANFAQAPVYSENYIRQAQQYIRSALCYSQFTTVASFDAIFLTDSMRMLYVDYHKKNSLLDDNQEELMRTRMINENKYFISFYVIGNQKEHLYQSNKALFTGSYNKQTDIFGSKEASWNISMVVDNIEYRPESIRIVDLPLEYRACLGAKFSQFHTAYLVRFAANNMHDHPIFEPNRKYKVSLKCMSANYEVSMVWKNIVYTKWQ